MTPYKIIRLFNIHKAFNPDKFKTDALQNANANTEQMDDIDKALGGF